MHRQNLELLTDSEIVVTLNSVLGLSLIRVVRGFVILVFLLRLNILNRQLLIHINENLLGVIVRRCHIKFELLFDAHSYTREQLAL
jgi:hypothetical protein